MSGRGRIVVVGTEEWTEVRKNFERVTLAEYAQMLAQAFEDAPHLYRDGIPYVAMTLDLRDDIVAQLRKLSEPEEKPETPDVEADPASLMTRRL